MWTTQEFSSKGGKSLKLLSKTDIGQKRTSNQDCVIGEVLSDSMAWSVVLDGMGGFSGGDVASRTAADVISEFFKDNLSEGLDDKTIKKIMIEATQKANFTVHDISKTDENLSKMGTTLVMCVVNGTSAHFVYVGDSRAYIVDEKSVCQISVDHSIVQRMLDSGGITPQEAHNHPQRNVITRAIGVEEIVEADYKHVKIKKGDKVFLCTDGLSGYLTSLEIFDFFQKNNLSKVPSKMIDECNNRGGSDNITVSIIEC